MSAADTYYNFSYLRHVRVRNLTSTVVYLPACLSVPSGSFMFFERNEAKKFTVMVRIRCRAAFARTPFAPHSAKFCVRAIRGIAEKFQNIWWRAFFFSFILPIFAVRAARSCRRDSTRTNLLKRKLCSTHAGRVKNWVRGRSYRT